MPVLHTARWRPARALTLTAWQRVTRRPRGKPSSSVSSKKRPDLKPTSGKWAGGSRDLLVHGLNAGVARVGDLTLGAPVPPTGPAGSWTTARKADPGTPSTDLAQR